MAEKSAGEQRRGSIDKDQGLLIPPATSKGSRGISSRPGISGEASLNLAAATSAPTPGDGKKPGYYSENGYLMELSRQERQRIQEIKKRLKSGEPLQNYE